MNGGLYEKKEMWNDGERRDRRRERERERGISGSEKSEKYERPGMGGWK